MTPLDPMHHLRLLDDEMCKDRAQGVFALYTGFSVQLCGLWCCVLTGGVVVSLYQWIIIYVLRY